METLVIKSSEWLRGKESSEAATKANSALNFNNRFCCLGLEAVRLKVEPDNLVGCNTPSEISSLLPNGCWMLSDSCSDSDDAGDCINLNDDQNTTDEEKIAALRPIFAKNGVEIDWRPNE